MSKFQLICKFDVCLLLFAFPLTNYQKPERERAQKTEAFQLLVSLTNTVTYEQFQQKNVTFTDSTSIFNVTDEMTYN